MQWKVKDAEFHMQHADAERRAALRAKTEEAASAHRQLAVEHQAGVLIATRVPDVSGMDEAEFLNIARRVAVGERRGAPGASATADRPPR